MNLPICKEFEFDSRPIRVLLTKKNELWFCAYDIAKALRRPSFLTYTPIFTMAPTAQKIKFDPARDSMWGIRANEIGPFFKSVRCDSKSAAALFDSLLEWVKTFTVTSFMEAKVEAHHVGDKEQPAQETALTKSFQYGDFTICFSNFKDNTEVNATQMAQAFNKNVHDWLRQKGTQEFLEVLSTEKGIPSSLLVKTLKGGNLVQGTWMQSDAALEFARWLSPKFAIWCNDRIKELLTIGMTATPQTTEELIANPDLIIKMATALKDTRAAEAKAIEERNAALRQLEAQNADVDRMKPKEEYYDDTIASRDNYSTIQLAAELGLDYTRLRTQLFQHHIIVAPKGRITATDQFKHWMTKVKGGANTFLRWTKEGRDGIFSIIAPNKPK